MIKTEMIVINGNQYIRTYSDKCHVERDGVQYAEAVDPLNSGREYIETEIPLPVTLEDLSAEKALEIITGEVK